MQNTGNCAGWIRQGLRVDKDFTVLIAELDQQTDLEARRWFQENQKVGVFSILIKMVSCFWTSYVSKRGHKDGVRGLFLAVNSGIHPFLSYAKYWEMVRHSESAEGGRRIYAKNIGPSLRSG